MHDAPPSSPHHLSCAPCHGRQRARAGFQAHEPEVGNRNCFGIETDERPACEQLESVWLDRPALANLRRCSRCSLLCRSSQGSQGSHLDGRTRPGDAVCSACMHGAPPSSPHHLSFAPSQGRRRARAGFQACDPEAGVRKFFGSETDERPACEQHPRAWHDRSALAHQRHGPHPHLPGLSLRGSEQCHPDKCAHLGDGARSA
mmetsp:Transcript_94829/g.237840  ORF Transcript_94829/g.237840 Transcript_94829/m.237840 type:complete len:202 (+) Transcript_94829:762-1367(+)